MRARLAPVLAAALAGCGALFNGGPAKVTFTSSPDGAEVWIDGMRRGTTPLVVDLQKNQDYTVVFKKEGHKEVVTTITRKVVVPHAVASRRPAAPRSP